MPIADARALDKLSNMDYSKVPAVIGSFSRAIVHGSNQEVLHGGRAAQECHCLLELFDPVVIRKCFCLQGGCDFFDGRGKWASVMISECHSGISGEL